MKTCSFSNFTIADLNCLGNAVIFLVAVMVNIWKKNTNETSFIANIFSVPWPLSRFHCNYGTEEDQGQIKIPWPCPWQRKFQTV